MFQWSLYYHFHRNWRYCRCDLCKIEIFLEYIYIHIYIVCVFQLQITGGKLCIKIHVTVWNMHIPTEPHLHIAILDFNVEYHQTNTLHEQVQCRHFLSISRFLLVINSRPHSWSVSLVSDVLHRQWLTSQHMMHLCRNKFIQQIAQGWCVVVFI